MAVTFNPSGILKTAVFIITKPVDFFRQMPKTGGYFDPLIFVIIFGMLSGIIQLAINAIQYGPLVDFSATIGSIIFMPLVVALFSFIGAAILYLIWSLMGSKEDFEAAYRGAAYLSALSPITTIIGLIPYLGTIVSLLIGLYYTVIVSIEVHSIPAKKAWLVFGVLTAIIGILSLMSTFAMRNLSVK